MLRPRNKASCGDAGLGGQSWNTGEKVMRELLISVDMWQRPSSTSQLSISDCSREPGYSADRACLLLCVGTTCLLYYFN